MGARAGHLLVAGLSGLCVIVLEFAAVRMMAPAFGQSITVWSAVVGVILVALALGYWLGGRLGERSRTSYPLFRLYGLCALWTLGASFWGADLCAGLIPTGIPVDASLSIGFGGSLLASLVLFAPPVLVLGMTSPFLIRLEAREGSEGRATGAIYAVGTLGSLAACYLAPLVLLQTIGTSRTIGGTAFLLLFLSCGGVLATRRAHRAGGTERLPSQEGATPIGRAYIALAFVTGLAVTVLEFGAVRFMAPWFGQSNYVWANVIGVILLALAVGSWVGGRWADAALARGPVGGRVFYAILGVVGAAAGAATLLGPGVMEILIPQDVESMYILPIAFRGSLFTTLVFFGPALLLLGMAPPFLVRMALRGRHAGRTAGVLFAWTTVGGLLGCLVTAPLLVPALGARGTLLAAGLALGALGAVALRPGAWRDLPPRRRRGLACCSALLALVPAVLLGIHVAGRAALRVQPGQVAEVESAYQTIRVVRRDMHLLVPFDEIDVIPALLGDDGSATTVFLRHDEDAETYQSVVLDDPEQSKAWLTGGRYFEHMALGAHFARPRRATLRVLLVGYAGGTVHRTLRDTLPEDVGLSVLGVEIDPAVIEVARDHLRHRELEGPGLELITGEDARTVVNALPPDRQFDLVLVDAYTRTNYLPFQLATVEFFTKLRAHLATGGWIGVNVLGHGMKSPVAHAVAATMARALGSAYVTPNPSFLGNVILWGSPDAATGPRLRADAHLHPGLEAAGFALERLTVRHDPQRDGGVVLTDDLSPSDRLADQEFGL